MAGRPEKQVDIDQLQDLVDAGYSKKDIADQVGICRNTLNKFLPPKEVISDEALDAEIIEAKRKLPEMGERLVIGYLRSKGLKIPRSRIRSAIHRVDPEGVERRKEVMGRTIQRRVYMNPHPHFLWHIDTNHKLIRWKLIIHAAIDGFSRNIIYLECFNNNKAHTVLNLFMHAVYSCGIPPRKVRTDAGVENGFIIDLLGPDALVGPSVHNQRVERLNGTINENIRTRYGSIFYHLEHTGVLDIDSALDIAILHYLYLPRINESLEALRMAYNHHPIAAERNITPSQLMARNMHLYPQDQVPPMPPAVAPTVEPDTVSDSDYLLENVRTVLDNAGFDPHHNDNNEGRDIFRQAKAALIRALESD